MYSSIHTILSSEEGQSAAEYAIILAFVALFCVGVFTSLGTTVRDFITSFTDSAYN